MFMLAALLGLASAHQSFGGGEDFAPHWEPPTWVNSDDPNGIKIGSQRGSGARAGNQVSYRGAEQDDNFMNKDDDRRVWAPAYDDHHSYQHHPVAHKYSDEHLMDDEGRSTRVIHGQDTSQHVNRRTKKKVFDTIKEPKHHFAVQSIDVPFPFHHHYYNHTKVHYHDGYDLYDDDVGDSEKYYHVNPDTHTNVDGWFADDHYRVSSEAFSDDGATEDDGFMGVRQEGAGNWRRSEDGSASGRGYNEFNSEIRDRDDGPDRRPDRLRYRSFADDRLAEWRMRNRDAGRPKFENTGTGTVSHAQGSVRGRTETTNARNGILGRKNDWEPFSYSTQLANYASHATTMGSGYVNPNTLDWETKYRPYAGSQGKKTSTDASAGVADAQFQFGTYSDAPLIGAGAIGSLGGRTFGNGIPGTTYVGPKDSNTFSNQDKDMQFEATAGPGAAAVMRNKAAVPGSWVGAGPNTVDMPGSRGTGVLGYNARDWGVGAQGGLGGMNLVATSEGTEGTAVGGKLSNYKYNWDNMDDSQYPRGIRENTSGQDDSDENDNVANNDSDRSFTDNDGVGTAPQTGTADGWMSLGGVESLAQAIVDALRTQFNGFAGDAFGSRRV